MYIESRKPSLLAEGGDVTGNLKELVDLCDPGWRVSFQWINGVLLCMIKLITFQALNLLCLFFNFRRFRKRQRKSSLIKLKPSTNEWRRPRAMQSQEHQSSRFQSQFTWTLRKRILAVPWFARCLKTPSGGASPLSFVPSACTWIRACKICTCPQKLDYLLSLWRTVFWIIMLASLIQVSFGQSSL